MNEVQRSLTVVATSTAGVGAAWRVVVVSLTIVSGRFCHGCWCRSVDPGKKNQWGDYDNIKVYQGQITRHKNRQSCWAGYICIIENPLPASPPVLLDETGHASPTSNKAKKTLPGALTSIPDFEGKRTMLDVPTSRRSERALSAVRTYELLRRKFMK